jgi:PAS domain S-box-containing protein
MTGKILYAQIIHPEDLPRVQQEALHASINPDTIKLNHRPYRIVTKDGATRWVDDYTTILREKDGRVAAYEGIVQDITDRKLVEETLRLIRFSIDQTKEGIFWVNADGRFIYANDTICKRLGYAREELLTMSTFDIDPSVTPENWPRNWEVLRKAGAITFKTRHRAKNGTLLPVELSIRLIEFNENEFSFCFSRDVTENKRAETTSEKRLPELARPLENARDFSFEELFKKEKELLKSQFQQARKLEPVGRLAGGVAHDLNNLLAPILGYSEMLLDDFSPNDLRRESVQNILSAGYRARNIVRQLLAFSRKQTMEIKDVNLNDVLARFEKLLHRTIREDIELKIKTAPDIPSIMGDISQLEQVVMNLAVNAQEAMPEGGLLAMETSLVDLEDEDLADNRDLQKGTYIVLAISDTGHGMDKDIQKHIFEPFFSTKGKRGTGLSLSTVYGIVKQHNGNIWVYSEPGEGTTFKIYLPVPESPDDKETASQPVETLLGFETILIAEDDDQIRTMTHNLLSRRGYHVLKADNGKEALKLLETNPGPVQLLLTDVVLPEMNGRELFEKAVEIQPDIQVLYMSGYTDNVIAHHGVLEKGVDFIQKPFPIRSLTTKIREILG